MKSVVVYCGSKTGKNPVYADIARKLGKRLADQGITLVFGGGKIGLMGIVSNTVMENGGKVIGVITELLNDIEVGNEAITELIVVKTMHERKSMMCERAEGAIILPGALGTLDELYEFATWNQLGIHNKPCGVLNVNAHYDLVLAQVNLAIEEGFLDEKYRKLFVVARDIQELLKRMADWKAGRPVPEKYKLV